MIDRLEPAIEKQGIEQPPHGVVWLTDFATHEPEYCIKLFIPNDDTAHSHESGPHFGAKGNGPAARGQCQIECRNLRSRGNGWTDAMLWKEGG
jgi:hypothetical protein